MNLLLCSMFIVKILILIVIVHAQYDLHDTCHNDALEFWRKKYERDYYGTDPPETRCERENGFCLRYHESCQSGDHIRYQTQCYNRCDCCFRKARKYGSSSNWKLVKRRLTWEKASHWCRNFFDGDLLVPENIAYVIEYLRENKMGATDVWVGINDQHLGTFEGIHGNKIVSGWQLGQPRLADDSEKSCVVVEDDEFEGAGMKVEPCNVQNAFICDEDDEHRSTQHPVEYNEKLLKQNYEEEGFGSDREPYYGTQVKIIGRRKNWKAAREDCQSRGGDLLVPESVSTFINYMRQEAVGSRDVWVGYADHYYGQEYEGVHGNIIKSGWQPGEPRHAEPGKDCVVIEDDARDGAGLKVEPCYEEHIYACDLTDHFDSEHSTLE